MKNLLAIILFFVCAQSFAQDGYGWYIVQKGAKYKYNGIKQNDAQKENYPKAQVGECVFVKGFQNNYFVTDGDFLFEVGGLMKIENENGGRMGIMQEDLVLLSGKTYKAPLLCWVLRQDISKGTFTILLDGGKEYELPQKNIIFWNVIDTFIELNETEIAEDFHN